MGSSGRPSRWWRARRGGEQAGLRRRLFALLVLGLASVFAVCVSPTPYVPDPDLPFEMMEEFTTRAKVSLENGQPSIGPVKVGSLLTADYKQWTDVAIEIAGRELGRRGAVVEPDAPKTLRLAITAVRHGVDGPGSRTEVDLRVETGDRYIGYYTGVGRSAARANVERQVDGAMTRVVVEMLEDRELVRYITAE